MLAATASVVTTPGGYDVFEAVSGMRDVSEGPDAKDIGQPYNSLLPQPARLAAQAATPRNRTQANLSWGRGSSRHDC